MPVQRHMTGFLVVVALGCVATPSSAQFAKIFGDSALSPRDVSAAQQAGNTLFASGDPVVGSAVRWRTETSGASGRAEIVRAVEEGRCVVVEHSVSAKPDAPVEVLRFRRCRTEAGEWVPDS